MRKIIIATAAVLSALAAAALWAAPSEADARTRIVATAESFKGVPYVYGAESPEAFDCSGLVQYVYAKAADLQIPRNSKGIWAAGSKVGIEEAKPGDIIVFDTIHAGGPSHVAIFKGDGTIIHAVSEGRQTGVIVSALKGSSFEKAMMGARCFVVSVFPASEPAKPAPEPTKPSVPVALVTESPVSQVGFTIVKRGDVFVDPIPAATGTAIAFTIANGTGKDEVFHIFFYKADKDFSKTKILREERAMIRAGASQEIPAYAFTESGRYRINVKTADNTQMMQRTWDVVELKR